MPFGGLLTVGLIGAGSSIFSGLMGSHAAGKAADQQVAAQRDALDFQKQIWGQQQQNLAPWMSAGNTSIAALMKAMGDGTFGAGSLPKAPAAPGPWTGTFAAPTSEEARNSPGYQFTAQQGSKSILQGAAAAGGAISGGTLKALDQFNTGLADSAYNDVFNRALSTYNTGVQGYQLNLADYNANLQGYQAELAKNAQEFSQMFAPAQLGEAAVTGLNSMGQNVALNVGNLMTGIGNSQAAGTVGSSNAITGAVNGGANSFLQSLMLSKILGSPKSTGTDWGAVNDALANNMAGHGFGPG